MVKLQPTQRTPAPEQKNGSGLKTFFILVLLAAAGYGGWMYWTKYRNPPPAQNANANPKAKTSAATATAEKPKLTTNNNVLARAKATLSKVSQFNKEGESAADQIQNGATKAPASAANTQSASATSPSNTQPWSAIPGMPRLQAIFYKPVDATALIEGKIVKAGDEVSGAKVVEVKKASVRMQLGNDIHEVTIK